MEFLYEYGLFFAKTFTLVAAIIVLIVVGVSLASRHREEEGELHISHLGERFKHYRQTLEATILSETELKAKQKQEKQAAKDKAKQEKRKAKQKPANVEESLSKSTQEGADEAVEKPRRRVFVLNFHGDIRASSVEALRTEITAILTTANAEQGDEVLLRLESPGGLVHSYGLAASQLKRIRDKGLTLTVAVDKVAASGGYMMACVGHKIIAAPFAVIGSIGVLAQLPNFHRLLKKHDVDFEQMTAGEYKRTLSLFAENTPEGREKFKEELEDTHELFKQHIQQFRPQLDLEKLATGEHWYGIRAQQQQLVDELLTSDDYLLQAAEHADLYEITYKEHRNVLEKMGIELRAQLDALGFYNRINY